MVPEPLQATASSAHFMEFTGGKFSSTGGSKWRHYLRLSVLARLGDKIESFLRPLPKLWRWRNCDRRFPSLDLCHNFHLLAERE